MNMVFSDIGLTTDVTLISVGNMSASTKDIYTLFDSLAQAGVDVDMISQPASWGSDIPLSFTVDDHALSDVVLGLGALKKRYPTSAPTLTRETSSCILLLRKCWASRELPHICWAFSAKRILT